MAETGGIPYKLLKQHHPEHDVDWFRKCKALYAGGRSLLSDSRVLRAVLPPHLNEKDFVYNERCSRAFYLNYPGSIIDLITAGLFAEQPAMECEPEADDWYKDFLDDVTPPGGRTMSFNDLLKRQITTALVCKRAWTLVELPDKSGEVPPENALEEEQIGALDCYAYPVDPECVRDWEMDEDGKLKWVLLAFQRNVRPGLTGTRQKVKEEFVYYTTDAYEKYEIEYDPQKNPPNDQTPVPLVASGVHTFGRVPLVCLELTEGMYAMGKLESIAVAHLNTRNALTWAQFKSLFPVPTAYLGEEKLGQPVTEDQGRAVNQVRSPAHVVVMGKDDRFEFAGPPTEPFQYAASDCAVLRDEMYRVVHHMANSIDNSAAALQRSGESKGMDLNATNIVLKFLGEEISKHACEVMECVCAGRKDVESDGECKYDWHMLGMEEFNQGVDMDALLKEAQAVSTLDINSPTFQAKYKQKVAKEVLGDNAEPEDIEKIGKELESNNPPEEFDPEAKRERQAEMFAKTQPKPDEGQPPQQQAMPHEPGEMMEEKKPAKKGKASKKAA